MTKTLEEFLNEHNRLSPSNLQATKEILLRFREEKSTLFAGDDWSLEKIRRPFLEWLGGLHAGSVKCHTRKTGWITFPRPADEDSCLN